MLNEHQITFRVRYPETDAMGVVHHSRYFQYFEMGRIELLRADGLSYAEMEMAGILFVVAKVECKYKAPARYDEELTLTTTVARRTHVRIDHVYTLKRGTTLIAEGATTIACVDRQGQLREIPETMIKDLQTE
jgi:acyl-CoA thioester hydrolase